MTKYAPSTKLFDTTVARAVVICDDDLASRQQFFERNPDYFWSVNGEAPTANEAHNEMHARLPEGWLHTWQGSIGFIDAHDALIGMSNVVTDLLAPGVFHIGLFIVATRLHGTGAAQVLHDGLVRWAIANGTRWLRLGVVSGNARAERFWARLGYVDLRMRTGIPMGRRVNDVRVMVNPLTSDTLADYLALVPRDRPDHP
jgi:GNAT superfamily N-acetyltransferase